MMATTSPFLAPPAKDRPASETRTTRAATNPVAASRTRSKTMRAALAHPLRLVVVVAALFTIFAGTAQADPYRLHHDYYRLIHSAAAGSGSAWGKMTGAIHGALAGGATTYGTRTGSGSAGGKMTGAIHGALAGGATTYGAGPLPGLLSLLTTGRRFTVQGAACAHGFATTEAPKQCGFGRRKVHSAAVKPLTRTSSDWSSIGVAAGAVLFLLLALGAGVLFRQRRTQPRPV